VYSIQRYVIQFVSELRQVGGFHRVLRFRPPITRMTTFASRRILYIFCIKFKIIMQGSLQLRFLPGYVRIGLLLTWWNLFHDLIPFTNRRCFDPSNKLNLVIFFYIKMSVLSHESNVRIDLLLAAWPHHFTHRRWIDPSNNLNSASFFFIEVPVFSHESKLLFIFALGYRIMICVYDFANIILNFLTVWYYLLKLPLTTN
jgi:hypothetical protein